MKNLKWVFLVMVVTIMPLTGCRSINGLKVFSKCKFDLKRIEDIKIAGIDVANKKSFSDFSIKDAANLGVCFLEKKLPLSMTFVMNIANNSTKTAILEKLDYIIAVDKKDVLSGKIENRIEVAPKTAALYYVKSDLDVIGLFNTDDLKENIRLALKLVAAENLYKEIELKVKPYIRVGNNFVSAPDYFIAKYQGQ
jgi:hypothetical protein